MQFNTNLILLDFQSFRHDGRDPYWYHQKCFFEKQRPKSTDEIAHFENIRYEDQQKIRNIIETQTSMPIPETSKGKKGKKRRNDETADDAKLSTPPALKDFGIEYSKSSRAECIGCLQKIMKVS